MRKAISHLKNADPLLAAVIERVGPCRMTFMEPDFHSLARSIVYQQLSTRAAATIFGRLVAAAGDPLTPRRVLKFDVPAMRAFGLSQQKAAYVRDLAERTAKRKLIFPTLLQMQDDDVIAALTEVKGVGVWTAHMFLMFALRRPNVLPVGDLGIRNAIRKVYGMKEIPMPVDIVKIAERWHPYCSIASWYLWRSLEAKSDVG